MLKAVIFDVDGTLVDSVDVHAQTWVDAFQETGRTIQFSTLRGQIGKGGDQRMPVFLNRGEMEAGSERINKRRGEILKEHYASKIIPFADVCALFERIKADGTRIVLASSAKADELKNYMRLAGIEGLTEAETSSDDAEQSKPEPDIFHAAIAKLGDVQPDEVIVIGDTPYDAQAAARAGLRTIGVLCGGFSEESLRDAGCIAIYQGPTDLLAHYDQSPLAPVSGKH